MIREDRELLAELARLNSDMVAFAMRLMDGSASSVEQQGYARRLIAAGERLLRRADETDNVVIDGEVLGSQSLALSERTVEPYREQ